MESPTKIRQNLMLNNPIVWKPKEDHDCGSKRFGKHISQKYGVKIENYWDLHRWSIENSETFWAEVWDYARVICSKPYTKILDKTTKFCDRPKWFIGAKLNYAENLLKRRDDKIALVIDGEERNECEYITFHQLYQNTYKYWAALKQLGVKKNDVVACYMSNRPEAIYAFIAATAIGAIWSGTLPLFGSQAVIKRFEQIQPKCLFTVDRFLYNRKEENLLPKLEEISNALTTLEKIIIVPSKPSSVEKDISHIRNSCFLDEFLNKGATRNETVQHITFEQVPFYHPLYISYTSGTTGKPKGVVHDFGSFLGNAKYLHLQLGRSQNDIWMSVSPTGWTTWHAFCHKIGFGQTLLLYNGVPYYLHPTSLWDIVDKHHLTDIFVTPSILDEFEKKNYLPGKHNHLTSLKRIFSAGSVVKKKNYDFVYSSIKKDIVFGSFYGGTEIQDMPGVTDESLPIHRGEISTPSLGVDMRCFNDDGVSVEGEIGEIVYLNPSPVFPNQVWNDTDGTLYKKSYFSKFPNVFSSGDLGIINPKTKGIIIVGRSDDTLNPGGCRFGCSEIYDIVNVLEGVKDSLCVSQYNASGLERAVLFVEMQDGKRFTENLKRKIENSIAQELSARHVPKVILETKEIPFNMNGKKMEIIVKKIINNMPYDADTVKNKNCLEAFQDIPELGDFD